jgi:acetylglutamate kinase
VTTVVLKIGGHALASAGGLDAALDTLADDLRALLAAGFSPVVVHGAGPQIDELLAERGLAARFVEGLRVTDDPTMDVVAQVLAAVNAAITKGLLARGVQAVSVRGADDATLSGTSRGEPWGRVAGSVTCHGASLDALIAAGNVPVVNPVTADDAGGLLNANADTVAGAIAGALGADALILLSDVDQLRANPDDPTSALAHATAAQLDEMVATGSIVGGMRPKAAAAQHALAAGAGRVVMANGTRSRAASDALCGRGLFTEVTR